MSHILLTGCTRGCGRALLDRLAERGHTVSGCGSNPKRVAALQAEFDADRHSFHAVDTSDDVAVRAWAETVLECAGSPDWVINNAATINANAPLWKVPAADFQRVMDVNVVGVANVIRHFAPAMVARGSGVIVNFSSTWGRTTSPEVAPYCASKWAIEGLTRSLADELPPGMAAVALNPGIINTEMLQSCFGEGAAAYATPEEWSHRGADKILALGTKDNGQTVDV